MRLVVLAVIVIASGGCEPSLSDCAILCDPSGGCPSGYSCSDGTCQPLSAAAACADNGARAGDAAPEEVAPSLPVQIRVRALIDGRSRLTFQAGNAQWHHLEHAAPGRVAGTEPTTINGVDWFPVWPDVPGPENAFCNCPSDVFSGVAPAAPGRPTDVQLVLIGGGGAIRLSTSPGAENDYTTTVEFDHSVELGAGWFEVDVRFTEPVRSGAKTRVPFRPSRG